MARKPKGHFMVHQKLDSLNHSLRTNADIISRMALEAKTTHGGVRDLWKIFGYKDNLLIGDYASRYDRGDIAERIIEAYPKACFASKPIVSDAMNQDEETPFELEVKRLDDRFQLFERLKRLDILSGVGAFGVLVIGVADKTGLLETPLETTVSGGIEGLLYLTAYSEASATVKTLNTDVTNPRFGLPEIYEIKTGGAKGTGGGTETKEVTLLVHHTRILHVAEGCLENDIYGKPRLQSIFNKLVDLDKIVGGSAEMFWLNARGGLHMDQEIESIMDATSKDALQENLDKYTHALTRYLKTKGISVQPIQFEVADPNPHFTMLMSIIAAVTGIPQRILMGSEAGSLASDQDENTWLSRVKERRNSYVIPNIIRPMIDKMILLGILPAPEGGVYEVSFEDTNTIKPLEQSQIAGNYANAIASFLNSGGNILLSDQQFVEDVLHMDYRNETGDDLNKEDEDMQNDLATNKDYKGAKGKLGKIVKKNG